MPNSANSKDLDFTLNIAIIEYIILGFLSLILLYFAYVCWNISCERQLVRMRNALYRSILRQDMSFFDKNSSGELNSLLNENIEKIRPAINFKFADFIILLLRGIGSLIFSMVLLWDFSIVLVCMTPLLVVPSALLSSAIKKYAIEELNAYGSAGMIAQEVLSSLRTVFSFSMEIKWIKKYSKSLENVELIAKKKGLLTGVLGGFLTSVHYLNFPVLLLYGIHLFIKNCYIYTPANLIAAGSCVGLGGMFLTQALSYLNELSEAIGAAKRIFQVINTTSLIDVFDDKTRKILPDFTAHVEFHDVYFSYPQRPDVEVLRGFNLNIPADKTVALVGASGTGKSTIVALLQRFYLPNSGSIRLDGHDINELDLNWLRSQMALVSQEPILFSTSIKENIRLGRLDASDKEIEEAARKSNAHGFIKRLRKGYETLVGERGVQLSGGEKQRIALARALIRNPRILLLDEATSALDYANERAVQDALNEAKIGRTTIIVAHRLHTIRNADIIVCLSGEDDRQQEIGTHEELMNLKGVYYKLINSQVLLEKEGYKKYDSKKKIEEKEIDEEKSYSKNGIETRNVDTKMSRLFEYERKLFKYHRSESVWLIFGTICRMLNGINYILVFVIFFEIFNIFSLDSKVKQEKEAIKLSIILVSILIINYLATIFSNYSFGVCGARLTTKLRVKLFESMLRQEIAFHDEEENKSSLLTSQLSASPGLCRGLTSDKISLIAQSLAGVGLGVVFCSILSWKLTLVMLLFLPIYFFNGLINGTISLRSNKLNDSNEYFSSEERLGMMIVETVENIKTVVSLNRERHFIEYFSQIDKQKLEIFTIFDIKGLLYSISNNILFFSQSVVYSFGYYLLKHDNLSLANIYRVSNIINYTSVDLGRLFSLMPDHEKCTRAAKTVFRIIDRKSKIDGFSSDEDKGAKPENFIGNIRFDNVYFKYPTRSDESILSGFNLEINNGEMNALVGSSGCGKSTTISLLLRLYDVDSGAIYLDGVDIRKLNIRWLRSQIGLVSQEPTLFNMSFYENICFGDVLRDHIDISEVIECAIQSNIHKKIETFPEGYETKVGSRGNQLSGGEKQRVAIARALIRRPRILLLDEATSSLDTESEQLVQDALNKAQVGRTCIVIAHRLSTIQSANKISVIQEGKLIEEGAHSNLMDNMGLYYSLYKSND